MLAIILDTGMFAVPPYAENEEAVHAMIWRLNRWTFASQGNGPVRLFKLSGADAVLYANNCWPLEPDVRTLLSVYNLLEVFSVNDILTAYLSLLSRASPLIDLGLEATECTDVTISPDLLRDHAPAGVTEQSKLAYANGCLSRSVRNKSLTYIASGLPHDGALPVRVTGSVTAVHGPKAAEIILPLSINDEVLLLDGLEDIGKCVDPYVLWSCSEKPEDFFMALSMACIARARRCGSALELKDIPPFSIGSDFITSLKAVQAASTQTASRVVFETCSRVVVGQPKYPLRPMGKPSQSVRREDGATAWRTHVTKGHVALRLMVWQSSGKYELANVGPKHELYIAPGRPSCAYSHSWS